MILIECADYLASFDPRGWPDKAVQIASQALSLKKKTLIVAKEDDEEIGFAAFIETDEIFLLSLAAKRSGVGTRIIAKLKEKGKPIWCGSEADGFYEKMGFVRDGEHDGFPRYRYPK